MKKYQLIESSPLQKFKNQNYLVKKFGKKALKVYNSLPKDTYASADEIANTLGFDKDEVEEILNFMVGEGMADVSEEAVEKPSLTEESVKTQKEEVAVPQPEEIKPEESVEPEKMEEIEKESGEPEPVEIEVEEPKIHEVNVPEEEKEEIKIEPEESSEESEEINIEPESEEVKESGEPEEEISIQPENEESEEEMEIKPEGHEEKVEEEENLTPSETIIYDKFGMEGVKIFRLVDGVRSVDEIAKEAGTTKEKVMEVLKFSQDVGLITMETQEEKTEEKFVPLTGELNEAVKVEREVEPVLYISYEPKDFLSKMKIKLNIVLQFARDGRKVVEYLESKKKCNIVDVVKSTKVPLKTVENVVDMLKREGVVKVRELSIDEINKEFGFDAYIIYKKYGVRGVVFYELIGEDINIKEIANIIGEKDPDKVIEIFELIHKVLGIPIPIDKAVLRKQLESG